MNVETKGTFKEVPITLILGGWGPEEESDGGPERPRAPGTYGPGHEQQRQPGGLCWHQAGCTVVGFLVGPSRQAELLGRGWGMKGQAWRRYCADV